MKDKIIIGRSDKIDLPLMHLYDLDAKVDTGAALSAIHCQHNIEIVEENSKHLLHFRLLDPLHPLYNNKDFYFEDYELKTIKNSFGDSEERYIINTEIAIFGRNYPIKFTLSDRENLKFPVLLGRQFLRKKFIVDVSKKDLSYKKKGVT